MNTFLKVCRAGGGGLYRYRLHLLGRLGQAEQCQFQLNALVAAAGHAVLNACLMKCFRSPGNPLLNNLYIVSPFPIS